ncbi:MAG: hypothetical protein R3B99_15445 [Polyangiales bacterium]
MPRALLITCLLGCSASLPPAGPNVVERPIVASAPRVCPTGGYVVVTERHADGPHRSYVLACDTRQLDVVEYAPRLDDGSAAHEDSVESFELTPDVFAALWRLVSDAASTGRGSCEPDEGVFFEVRLTTGGGPRTARCDGRLPGPWARVHEALQTEAERFVLDERVWPFGWEWSGDYWRDELGYYRAEDQSQPFAR